MTRKYNLVVLQFHDFLTSIGCSSILLLPELSRALTLLIPLQISPCGLPYTTFSSFSSYPFDCCMSPSLFFSLSFSKCKDPQRFCPLLHYLLTSPSTWRIFQLSKLCLSKNDAHTSLAAFIAFLTEMSQVPGIWDIQNQSVFPLNLLFLLHSLSWLKMSSATRAGNLRVSFSFSLSFTSYIQQDTRFYFSAKCLFLCIFSFHCQWQV